MLFLMPEFSNIQTYETVSSNLDTLLIPLRNLRELRRCETREVLFIITFPNFPSVHMTTWHFT